MANIVTIIVLALSLVATAIAQLDRISVLDVAERKKCPGNFNFDVTTGKCRCGITKFNCKQCQKFDASTCKCYSGCNYKEDCGEGQKWDPKICACIDYCTGIADVRCKDNFVYDETTCSCRPAPPDNGCGVIEPCIKGLQPDYEYYRCIIECPGKYCEEKC